jgi:hypothetical protein
MSDIEEIDRLSRETLNGWNEPPPAYIAAKISKRMFWFNFWHYKILANLKFGVPAMIIITVITAAWIWPKGTDQSKTPMPLTASSQNTRTAHSESNNKGNNNTATLVNNSMPQNSNVNNPLNTGLQKTAANSNISAADNSSNDPIKSKEQGPANSSFYKNTLASAATSAITVPQISDNLPQTSKETGSYLTPVSARTPADPFIDNPTVVAKTNAERITGSSWRTPSLPCSVITDKHSNEFIYEMGKKVSKAYKRRPLFDLSLVIAPFFTTIKSKEKGVISTPCMPSGAISVELGYHIKNFLLETGLQYSYLKIKQKGNDLIYNPRDIITQNMTGQELVIDTGGFWHNRFIQDSMLHFIDSTWEIRYDSTLNNIYDYISSKVYDTLSGQTWKANISILEIPIAVGYRFFACKSEFSIKGGILFGIISSMGGSTYYKESSVGLVRMSELYSTKGIQYSYFIKGSIAHNINENWAVEVSPCWRSSINGLKGKEWNPSMKYGAWGLGFGVRYEF